MYAGVPTVVAAAVPDRVATRSTAFAMPKSETFTDPSWVSIRFSGFRSRCTMPRPPA
jgi:hypothetical protein